MLLAEELLVLYLDPETGRRTVGEPALEAGLAGALVAGLVLAERVGVEPKTLGRWRTSRITVVSEKPTDDAELVRALTAIADNKGRKVKDLVGRTSRHRLTRGLLDRLLVRLTAGTVVTEQRLYALGLISCTVWPIRDPPRLAPIRERLTAALAGRETLAERTAALIGLLYAMRHLAKVVPGADRRSVRSRAAELSVGGWVAAAVKQALTDESWS